MARELCHTTLPAWGTDSILHPRGVNSSAPQEQGGLCVKPKDVLRYETPTKRKDNSGLPGRAVFLPYEEEEASPCKDCPPQPALLLGTASSCPPTGKRSPPLPHGKPAAGRHHPASGRGDAAAGVGLWGAEPGGCPPLPLPTFPSEESTSARLQGSGPRRFIWQELTEGCSQPCTDAHSTSCSSQQCILRRCVCKRRLAQAAASPPHHCYNSKRPSL